MYRKLTKDIDMEKKVSDLSAAIEPETGEIEELAPVEEENDFGELLEVEEEELKAEQLDLPVHKNDDKPEDVKFQYTDSAEVLEELEVIDEPVEELESIDD